MTTTDTQLMRSPVTATGALAVPGQSYEDVRLLDVYAGGLAQEDTRMDALATISAGWKNDKGMPQVSRDRTIKLHDPAGRAPGLKAALERSQYKRLLIAFPFDEPSAFIFQRFAEYSASRTLFSGNERGITHFDEQGERTFYPAGSPGYQKALERPGMKVETWAYFHAAEIDEDGAFVVFPDGGLPYRHRFTSRNSLRSLRGSLNYIRRFTGGRLAGIPFELAIDNRDVADGKGARHTAPVWTWTPKLTAEARLDSRQFSRMVRAALAQGEALRMLPPPSAEAIEYAALREPEIDEEVLTPTEAELATLEQGGLCDYAHWIKTWHALARGTAFNDDGARAAFIGAFTDGKTDSLADFLEHATEARAAELITALGAAIANANAQTAAANYDRIIGSNYDDEPARRRAPATPAPAPATPAPAVAETEPEDADLVQVARERNEAACKEAEEIGVKGVKQLRWAKTDTIEDIERKTFEAEERTRSRNNEIDAGLASQSGQAQAF